ncbi:DMT family transporter [bacterium]|nr:DMT family transporter [bacterium]
MISKNVRAPWLASYLACFFFALMAVCVRKLQALPMAEVMCFRCSIPVMLYVPMILRSRASLGLAWRSRWALLSRGLCGTLALYFYLLAVRFIPLADVAVTTNTSPLWTALAAWWTLGERMSSHLLWAFPVSFCGVALVAGSHASGQPWGYLAGLASAALSGSAYALLRKLRDLPPEVTAMAFLGLAALCSFPFTISVYQAPRPEQIPFVLGMGLSGAAGQWFMTLGYRYNSAATAASLGLATVALTAALAYLYLGEPLSVWQMLGMVLIGIGTLGSSRSPR